MTVYRQLFLQTKYTLNNFEILKDCDSETDLEKKKKKN